MYSALPSLFVLCQLLDAGVSVNPTQAPISLDGMVGRANISVVNSRTQPPWGKLFELQQVPDLQHCVRRHRHVAVIYNNDTYMSSSNFFKYRIYNNATGSSVPLNFTWQESLNECAKWCMRLVSLDTARKFHAISKHLEEYNISSIWTSGHLCDVEGCDQIEGIDPKSQNGWYWANRKALPPTNEIPEGYGSNPWSQTGSQKIPQPDQAELSLTGETEACVALMNNAFNDGVKLHDKACYHKRPFVCEDSPELLKYIEDKYKYALPDLQTTLARIDVTWYDKNLHLINP